MNVLYDIQDYARENWISLLGVVFIIALIVGYLLFTLSSILPQWRLREELTGQVETSTQALNEQAQAQQQAPQELQAQIATAEQSLQETAAVFLTETEAAAILDRLYQYAAPSEVEITELQAQPAPAEEEEKAIYDTREFHLQVAGDPPQLLDFVARVEETTVASFVLTNLAIEQTETQTFLSLDILLYTSPYASGETIAGVPQSTLPTPSPASGLAQLRQELDQQWAAAAWPEVIETLGQMKAMDPDAEGLDEKLYAAHTNYGYTLVNQQQPEEARAHFEAALAIQPSGAEAMRGLQSLATASPTPVKERLTHVVRQGETLFSIARQYNTTVDAIRVANGLTGNRILVGQELIIPR